MVKIEKKAISGFSYVLFFFLLLSCGGKSPYKNEDSLKTIYEKALLFYEREEYEKSIEGFKKVIFGEEVTELTRNAQFYLAMCYLKMKDYETALVEFEFLKSHFPESKFVEEGEFRYAQIYYLKSPAFYYDQDDLKKCISLLNKFLMKYKNGAFTDSASLLLEKARDKLAKKILETGKLYVRMGKEKAGKIYFQTVIRDYPDTKSAQEAKDILGKIN